MDYEVFLQGPEVYIPIILLSLAITLIAYGAFPLIFAKIRKAPITKKKYRWICYGINLAAMFVFIILNGEANGSPYLLWTWIFSNRGVKILSSRGVLADGPHIYDTPDSVVETGSSIIKTNRNFFCRNCGEKLIENSRFCRKCGTEVPKT